MLTIPIVGALYDKHNHRVLGAVVGCLIFAVGWLALTLGADAKKGGALPAELAWVGTPWLATVGLALGCSFFLGAMWPCIPLLVPPEHVGLAFGVRQPRYMRTPERRCSKVMR
jgi:hypothetical protein